MSDMTNTLPCREAAVTTRVIKRDGQEVRFDISKIVNAISKANHEVDCLHQLNQYQIQAVADTIAGQIRDYSHAVHVEDIQDMVEAGIMEMRGYEVARKYVRYRYKRVLTRKSNTNDDGFRALMKKDHLKKADTVWDTLNYEEKNNQLFLSQKKTLGMFLERGAISREQHDKSLHDLIEKMGNAAKSIVN